MTTIEAKKIVLTQYVNAWMATRATSTGTMYLIVPWDKAIGSIGWGSTPGLAWKDAARVVQAKMD